MKILAFETSCDDTSIALFEDDRLIFMDTASQIKIHLETGGVVPEVAAREHANAIFGVLDNVLKNTNTKLEEIDYIGVTVSPGLLPSLLTGTTVASTISIVLNIPIIAINHIQAHIFSNFLEREESEIRFPIACLTVSGGHNDIYIMKDMWDLNKLGSSGDDAGGEAFDKVAKMMGLGYPGGPIISKLASEYEADGGISKNLFPRVWLVKRDFNFSFSGLKSSVKREVDRRISEKGSLSLEDKKEISFEFENAITEVLAWKLVNAAKENNIKTVMLAGGVSANNKLKDEIKKLADSEHFSFIFPKRNLFCMDNAAMVGILTYYKIKYKNFEEKIGVVKI
ncbi:MAG: tRNA (adenosine(37)-N6)-threonylcarbamoyltransferase complex transferase subunit TsaD [Candidatus Gracilibacteria bacterium]|nr:tRNA (adenosine(37)-N6)-threonylcarbamoyltransferase complex transferase subunit TsaD [Candidatus Gracilibacteria bacterium]